MNPQPVAESIADCYPENYGPHRSADLNTAASTSVNPEAIKPWYMRFGAGSIPGLKALYDWLADKKSAVVPTAARGESAVEIGCANGDFMLRLREAGWEVQGVEPVETAVETARQRGLSVKHGTLDTVELPADSTDMVFAWMVIEHVPEPRRTLEQIHRILKRDGVIAFSIPNFGCWEPRVFGPHWDAFELPRHLQHFTPKTITRLLQSTGFTDVSIVHQRNLLNVVGSLGFKLRSWFPNSRIARKLIEWPHNPTMWTQLAIAPVAKFLAAISQGGRLTITAKKTDSQSHGVG
ncbi:MAG: class I SAM-dependent methyltransferase [Rubripirellula sp.]